MIWSNLGASGTVPNLGTMPLSFSIGGTLQTVLAYKLGLMLVSPHGDICWVIGIILAL